MLLFKQLKAKKKAEAIRAAADKTTAEEAVVDKSAKAELHAEVATEEPILIETASSSVTQLSMDDQLVELQRWVTVGSHRVGEDCSGGGEGTSQLCALLPVIVRGCCCMKMCGRGLVLRA